MGNPNKAKGTPWETAVASYLTEHLDPETYKPRQAGHADLGDIHSAGAVWQAKDWRSWEAAIREGLDGAVSQSTHARKWPPVAVVKRARRPVGEAYAVLRLEDAVRLVARAREADTIKAAGMTLPPGGTVYPS